MWGYVYIPYGKETEKAEQMTSKIRNSMKNKTEAIKVTLRPSQIKKVKRIAKKDYEGNFSLTLRVMIDKFKEGRDE